jgi:hypothetical protein
MRAQENEKAERANAGTHPGLELGTSVKYWRFAPSRPLSVKVPRHNAGKQGATAGLLVTASAQHVSRGYAAYALQGICLRRLRCETSAVLQQQWHPAGTITFRFVHSCTTSVCLRPGDFVCSPAPVDSLSLACRRRSVVRPLRGGSQSPALSNCRHRSFPTS